MEMAIPTTFDKFVDIITDLLDKIRNTLHTVMGWCIFLMSYLLAIFGPKAMLFHWVLIAILIDLVFGCVSAYKRKEFHISTAFVSTAIKFVMYLTLFCIPMILEKVLADKSLAMGTSLVTAFLCSAEFFSALAHMLIIKPDLVVVKIFRKFLVAEIARKIKSTPDQVMDMFEIKSKKNKSNE